MYPKNGSTTDYVIECELDLVNSKFVNDLVTKISSIIHDNKLSGVLERSDTDKAIKLYMSVSVGLDYAMFEELGDMMDAFAKCSNKAGKVTVDVLHKDRPVKKFYFYLGSPEQRKHSDIIGATRRVMKDINVLVELKAFKELCQIIHKLDQTDID